jgi:hypothetical protein
LVAVAAVVAAAAGRIGDARLRARERGLGAGEKSMGTPPSSSSPARNRESSARACAPVADERAEAGGPERGRETGFCGCGGTEGEEDTRNGTVKGGEGGTRAASSATILARDCTGPCIGVASLSGSSWPLPYKAGPDDPERKGRPLNGEPRAGAAGRKYAAGTASAKDTAGADDTAGAEGAAGKAGRVKWAKRTAP